MEISKCLLHRLLAVNTVSPSLKTQIKRVGTLSNRKIEIESERDVQLRPILPNET